MFKSDIDICQICLRADKKLGGVDKRLSEFHDEFVEFSLETLDPQYCMQCENLLRKAYLFRARCRMAAQLIQSRKMLRTPRQRLFVLLPPTSLGIWTQKNSGFYQYTDDIEEAPDLNNPVNKLKRKIELEPEINKAQPRRKAKKQRKKTKNIVDPTAVEEESQDPLINQENQIELVHLFEREVGAEEVHNDFNSEVKLSAPEVLVEHNTFQDEKVLYAKQLNKDEKVSNGVRIDMIIEKIGTDAYEINIQPENLFENLDTNADNQTDDNISNFDHHEELDTKINRAKIKDRPIRNIPKKRCYRGFEKQNTATEISDTTTPLVVNDDKDNQSIIEPKGKRKYVRKTCISKKTNYNKERLKEELLETFKNFKELKTDDGTVIDKQCILKIIEERPPDLQIKELWNNLQKNGTFTSRALCLLKRIQNKYSQDIENVFEIEVLKTKERVMEEFQKRQYYDSYVNAKYKCQMCYQAFKHEKKWQYHMDRWHDEASEFVCSICNSRRRTQDQLNKHKLIHARIYKCKLCPLITNYRETMVNHYEQHKMISYRCQSCGFTGKSRSSYQGHIMRCPNRVGQYICRRCARCFQCERGLTLHGLLKHRDDPPIEESKAAPCSKCSLTFVSQEILEMHVKISHAEIPPFKQEENNAYVRRRRRNIEPRVIRNPCTSEYTCRVCNATYKNNGRLVSHYISEHPSVDTATLHIEKAKYLCDFCGKGFPNNGRLVSHYISEHPSVDTATLHIEKAKYLCDFCGKGFPCKSILREHMNTHTGSQPYSCGVCDKKFHRAQALKTHLQTHGPPTRPCPRCGKLFRTLSNLNNHMRIHIGDRRFKCGICGKDFLHRNSVNAHVRGVHNHVRRVKKRKNDEMEQYTMQGLD